MVGLFVIRYPPHSYLLAPSPTLELTAVTAHADSRRPPGAASPERYSIRNPVQINAVLAFAAVTPVPVACRTNAMFTRKDPSSTNVSACRLTMYYSVNHSIVLKIGFRAFQHLFVAAVWHMWIYVVYFQ